MRRSGALILLLVIGNAACAQTVFSTVPVNQFQILIDSLPDAIVLDLRTADELKSGMIANAQHLDYFQKDFEARITQLDPTKTYLLYCASGGRSGETMAFMHSKGFKSVYNLDGGFNQWKKKKMPVKAYKGQ